MAAVGIVENNNNSNNLVGKRSIDNPPSILPSTQTPPKNENSPAKKEPLKDKDVKPKRESVFKYTDKDNQVYEAILLNEIPIFLHINNNGEIKFADEFIETTRILKPPPVEEYPYIPYSFKNTEEINKFVDMIKKHEYDFISLLFFKVGEYASKFIIHHDYVINYLSSLIVFSYFQDKFSTIPYTMFVADNSNGKSSIGNLFEFLGYRAINMTDPTTANVFRIFGTVEAGQCTLVLDEAERIDQDKDMMNILKTGYENGKRVQRINPFTNKPDHYHTFGIKMMLAERSPNPSKARGFLDRTFVISNHKGHPQLNIKEVKNALKNSKNETIRKELLFVKKAMLVFRLLHFEKISDIETGLEERDKEICKPMLQLFYGSRPQKIIEKSLEILLDEKNNRKANSLERDILESVVDLFKEYSNGMVPFNEIWTSLTDRTNGHSSEYKQNELETEAYGTIYKMTVSRMLRDKFGAEDPKTRDAKSRSLSFNVKELEKHLENYKKYQSPTKINCYAMSDSDSSDSNDSNMKDLFDKVFSPNDINSQDKDSNDVQQNNDAPLNENLEDVAVDDKKEIFRCYYNCDIQFTSEQEYVKHCVMKHHNKPAFPSLVDIENHGLKSQGKRWETPPLS